MKTLKTLISIGAALFILSPAFGWSADVTLSWNSVDFGSVGSDPAKSGYKLYVSYDDGATKTHFGGDLTVDNLSYGPFDETGVGKTCYFATAFNNYGESGYSIPACVYIETGVPPTPNGVEALLQEIIALLESIMEKM